MRKTFLLAGMIVLLLTACKKSSSDNGSSTVTYQVTATNSSGIAITYNNVLENKVQVNAQSSWTMDVVISQKPFHGTFCFEAGPPAMQMLSSRNSSALSEENRGSISMTCSAAGSSPSATTLT